MLHGRRRPQSEEVGKVLRVRLLMALKVTSRIHDVEFDRKPVELRQDGCYMTNGGGSGCGWQSFGPVEVYGWTCQVEQTEANNSNQDRR